ncbi:MAG: PIN domain-containing protein [Candidatus Aenigmarchaeota archaeon]|nr:PIN domain-containing protein [Candidatus Aenigmarchaeota archaeon]
MYFDTYALIEVTKNSPSYAKFMEETIITTKFNLVELFFILLEQFGEEKAKEGFKKFKDSENDVSDEILFKAMKFRLQNRKKGFSYIDCIGYAFSKENGMKFLTGDNAFKGMDNVEFVK